MEAMPQVMLESRYQGMKERSRMNRSILWPNIMALLSLMHSIMPFSGFSARM